jgi:hypothetical protein
MQINISQVKKHPAPGDSAAQTYAHTRPMGLATHRRNSKKARGYFQRRY